MVSADQGVLRLQRKCRQNLDIVYQTASEVIREGLCLLRERDHRLEVLRRDVRAGFEAVGRGEFTDYDAGNIKELSNRINARGRKRLAEEERKTDAR